LTQAGTVNVVVNVVLSAAPNVVPNVALNELGTEATVVVIEVLVDGIEALPEEPIDPHLHADENSPRREKTATIDDVTEIETTMREDDQEVPLIVKEIVRETEMNVKMIVPGETNVMTSEPMVTTAKVWTNSMYRCKKHPADSLSAPDSPVPAHDELDTAE
jgi:hypothetical protein